VKLNLREKQSFYHELGRFLHSGITLPQAVETLLPDMGRGSPRRAMEQLLHLFRQGESVPNAFANLRPAIGDMEVALISASSNSGRLEQALGYLSQYFGTLDAVRSGLIKGLSWPVIQLHLAIVMLGVAFGFLQGQAPQVYLLQIVKTLACIYAVSFALMTAGAFLLGLGRNHPGVDRLLRMVPLIGKLRRNLALNRFLTTYEMQLEAGINVLDSLRASAVASQSGLIRRDIETILPQVLGGKQVGFLLADSTAFPASLRRIMRTGETTGTLDKDLRDQAAYYHTAAMANLETLGSWLPRIIYCAIMAYVGYLMINVWSTMFQSISKMGEF
jgi:protein transport protein HofC